jgi:hypothetical protein
LGAHLKQIFGVTNDGELEAFSGWIRTPTPRAVHPEVPTTTVEVTVLVAKDRLVRAIAIRWVSDLSA